MRKDVIMEKFYFFLRCCYAKAYLKIWGNKWGFHEVDGKSATYPWIFCVFVLIPVFKIIQNFLEKNQGKLGLIDWTTDYSKLIDGENKKDE